MVLQFVKLRVGSEGEFPLFSRHRLEAGKNTHIRTIVFHALSRLYQKNHAPFQTTQSASRKFVMAWAVMASLRRPFQQTSP